jgi:archaemetzincin
MPGSGLIAIAAVGDIPHPVLESVQTEVRTAFSRDVQQVPSLELPRAACDPRRQQYRSACLLGALARAKRPDWERLLGVVDVDLYVPGLNFVFGEASRSQGVAVFSLARLHAAAGEEARFLRRVATEAIHELGHTYGLGHCRRPDCVMWFSNTLSESDRKGTRFCSEHAAELSHPAGR